MGDDLSRSREFSVSARPHHPATGTPAGAGAAQQRDSNCMCGKGCDSLHAAASSNSPLCLASFLRDGCDPNEFNSEGATPLYCSTLAGALDTMSVLLATDGIDLNAGSKASKNSPLMRAAHQCNIDALQLLLRHGARVEHRSVFGFSALVCAVSSKPDSVPCVRALLAAGASTAVQCADRKYSALHYAAHLKATEIISALLEYGADVSLRCKIGRCFTHVAARQGDATSLRLALDASLFPDSAGAVRETLSVVDSTGMTALHCALAFGHEEAASVLLGAVPAPPDSTLLRLAVTKQLPSCIRELVTQHGHDVNTKAKKTSVLYGAAVHCMAGVVRVLLELGAKVDDSACGGNLLRGVLIRQNPATASGTQPSSRAAVHDVLTQLLDAGATGPTPCTQDAQRALCIAVETGVPDTLLQRLVLDAGFPANSVQTSGSSRSSAVGKAIQLGRLQLAEFLIAAGALDGLPADDTCHPALQAARGGHGQLLNIMLQSTDDRSFFDVADAEGNTLLHLSADSSEHSAVQAALLCSSPAQLSARNRDFETPLTLAAATDGVFSLLVGEASDEQLRQRDSLGQSLLHICAANGCLHNCKVLVDRLRTQSGGSKKDAVSSAFINDRVQPTGPPPLPPFRGPTPLHLACANGHQGVTALLLLEGCNPRLGDFIRVSGSESGKALNPPRPSRRGSMLQHLRKMGSGRSLLTGGEQDEEGTSISPVLRHSRRSGFDLRSRGGARLGGGSMHSNPFGNSPSREHRPDHSSIQSNLAPVQPTSISANRAPPAPPLQSIFERSLRSNLMHAEATANSSVSFQTDVTKRTPLHAACMAGHRSCIAAILHSISTGEQHALLVSPRVALEAADGNGDTPIHLAAAGGHAQCIQSMLAVHPSGVLSLNRDGDTPLHIAAEGRFEDAVAACVQAVTLARALHRPSGGGPHSEETHAESDSQDSDSTATMSTIASDDSSADLDPWALVALDATVPLTILLARAGFDKQLHSAVQSGISSVFDVDERGNTALHAAVHAAALACVAVLLALGADVNAQNRDGDTPLHLAAQMDDKASIKALLEQKPDLHVRNSVGCRSCDLVANPALQLQLTPLSRTLNWESLRRAELHWHIVVIPSMPSHPGGGGAHLQLPCQLQQFDEPSSFLLALCKLQGHGQGRLLTTFAAREYIAQANMCVSPVLYPPVATGGEFGRISVKVNGAHTACAVKRLVPRQGRTLQDLVQETEYEIRVQQSLQNTEHIARVLGCVQVPRQHKPLHSSFAPAHLAASMESTYDGSVPDFETLGSSKVLTLPTSPTGSGGSAGAEQQLASVAEYVPGCTWGWFVETLGEVASPEIKMQLATSLVTAVQQLHAQEVAHRDLHGGNVMVHVTAEGWWSVKLIDFGLAYPWSAGADDYMSIALGRVHASLRRPGMRHVAQRPLGAQSHAAGGAKRLPRQASDGGWQAVKHAKVYDVATDEYEFSCSAWMDVLGLAILLSWLYLQPSALPEAVLSGMPEGKPHRTHPSYVGTFMLNYVWGVPGALGGGVIEACILELLAEIGVHPDRTQARPNLTSGASESDAVAAPPAGLQATYSINGLDPTIDWSQSASVPPTRHIGDGGGANSRGPTTAQAPIISVSSDYHVNAPPGSYAPPPDWGRTSGVDLTKSTRRRSLGATQQVAHAEPVHVLRRVGSSHGPYTSLARISRQQNKQIRPPPASAPPPPAQQWSMAAPSQADAPPPPPPPRQLAKSSAQRSSLRLAQASLPSPWTRPTRDVLESVSARLRGVQPSEA